MSAAKHTPGPWSFEGDDASDDIPYFVVGAGEGETSREVAQVQCTIIDGARRAKFVLTPEDEANARLIAAAPDHALICWAMCVQDGHWVEWATPGVGEFCFAGLRHSTKLDEFGCPLLTPNLRAVLAKARGDA